MTIQIEFPRDTLTEQHITDAQRADDFPEEEIDRVSIGHTEITVEGTRKGIRWLYDYLQHLVRAWRAEGEQWDADAAQEMAESLWNSVDGDLPEQQRNRKVVR